MKTTLLILTSVLIAGSADAAGAKKRAQNKAERNATVAAEEREGLKTEAQDNERIDTIKKFLPAPGSVAEFELTHEECPTNAIALYQDEAEKGDPKAQYIMGKALLYGIGCATNASMAYAWAKKSADSGFASGINLLGACYQMGAGVEKDPIAAFEQFKKAADGGSLKGMWNMGHCYMNGDGVEKDEAKAVALIEKAAKVGLVGAMVEMGMFYYERHKASRSLDHLRTARQWFRKSAEADSKIGKAYYVINWYQSWFDLEYKEISAAEKALVHKTCVEIVEDKVYRRINKLYEAVACVVLGRIFEVGWGREVDLMQAMDWYEQAAQLDNSNQELVRELNSKLKKKYNDSTIASMRKRYLQKKAANGATISGSNTKGMVQSHKEVVRLTSFCGIKFGDVLPQTPILGEKRTKDGKYLVKTVKLQKPFQGMDHATVFASIKTRKICCVQLEWTTEGFGNDKVPEGKSVVGAVLTRYTDAEKIPHDMPDGFMNLHSEEYKVNGGTVSIEWVQRDFMYPPTRLQLTARNDELMRLAEEEYNQESGGDGSSVL